MTGRDSQSLRLSYARQVLATAGVAGNAALGAAFAAVPREDFLGPPPWTSLGRGRRIAAVTPDDLDRVYSDVLFVLDAEQGINNGEPSLHALLIDALAPKPGETVVHVGAGTGYYSAILAELVGETGRVVAVEADARLAGLARRNLAGLANVGVAEGDGANWPETPADGVYVSFAVAAPADTWIERLGPGGRLVFPLGVPGGGDGQRYSLDGAMFRITRQEAGFAARFLCAVAFIFGGGAAGEADPDLVRRLARAFASGGADRVRSLVWKRPVDPARCWLHTPDWSLCRDPPDAGA